MELRDGTHTDDPRLDRLVHFDERSRAFPVRTLLGDAAPKAKTWRIQRQQLDQGAEGACVGFAMAHELIAAPRRRRVLRINGQRTPVDMRFAREHIYWAAQAIDPWQGGAYPGASPNYEGTSVLAGVKVLQQLGLIGEYRWAFSLEELIAAVLQLGPAVLGVPWYDSMYRPDADGYLRVSGRVVGGHAILCRGVDTRRERFTLHNSWSTFGKCYVTFDDMARLLAENGEAVVPLERL
jgi:hypothetical protein